VDVARAQDGGDRLVGVAVEDGQRQVPVLVVVAVVRRPPLVAVRRVVGAVEVEDDPRRDASAFAFVPADLPSAAAKREQAPRSTACSRRDSVGWLARSGSLAGRRPQTALSKGSRRGVSAPSRSSSPRAIWNTRGVTSVRSAWRGLSRRRSGTCAARAAQTPVPASASLNQANPPSEVTPRAVARHGKPDGWCGRLGHAGRLRMRARIQHPYPYQIGAPRHP
jgi:hypothetical protein